MVLSLAVIIAMCACGDEKAETYKWPDTELGKLLPEIAAEVTSLSSDEDSITATLKIDRDEYKEYRDKCKESGFTEKEDSSEYDDTCFFTARDKAGNELSLSFYDDDEECNLSLESAAYLKKIEEENAKEEKEAAEKEKAAKAKKAKKKKASSSNADFKKVMDDYEDFMDDYIAFMKKYKNSDDAASMASDYADMMTKYEKYVKKIDKMDTGSLTADELAYYNEVTQRVTKKLTEVQ